MSETEFTPGPWEIVRHHGGGSWSIRAMQGPIDVCPAAVHGLSDAHLIAAAPDLYDALKTATAMLRVLVPEEISVRETLAHNEAVLAAARGEPS